MSVDKESQSNKQKGIEEDPLVLEIERMRNLREDVLLLRFYLDRRTDISSLIDKTERLLSESALKSSLEILEAVKEKRIPAVGHVAATASALMHSVGVLIHATRMAAAADGTSEESFPVTPQTLRASLPRVDIEKALGRTPSNGKRITASDAADFLRTKSIQTIIFFVVAVLVHFFITTDKAAEILKALQFQPYTLIPISGFFWALVGSLVWILMRFRTFGSAYAFDPAHAKVFIARVFSGSVISAILLLFIFGGGNPLVKNWQINIPLWGFVIGYAGRLQVEILRLLVTRVETAISAVFPPSQGRVAPGQPSGSDKVEKAEDVSKPPPLGTMKKPAPDENEKKPS
jgi:hypothetical protein